MRRRLLFIIIIALLIGGGVTALSSGSKTRHPDSLPVKTTPLMYIEYYSPAQFQKSIAVADKLPDKISREITVKAGIFPHDLNHAEYAAHLLKYLQKQRPSNILLIGPNHFEHGTNNLLTTDADWSTPFGIVNANKSVINELKQHTTVGEDKQTIQDEHAINGILPYLEYYLPDTQLIPLILKSEVTLKDIEYLLPILSSSLPADTVVLASVDFSHYLTSQQAEINDQITARALASLNYQTIMSFGRRFNDYVDSPASIALLLTWVKRQGLPSAQILFNTNSGILANDFSRTVTSYFEVIYY